MDDVILFVGALVIVAVCLGFVGFVDSLYDRTIRAERERERLGASLALGLFGCRRDRKGRFVRHNHYQDGGWQ